MTLSELSTRSTEHSVKVKPNLDSCFEQSLPHPAKRNIADFLFRLEPLRNNTLHNFDQDTWQMFCRKNRTIREWKLLLMEDPYTRHGFIKPCGYPGDANLTDYACRHPSIAPHITKASKLGRYINQLTTNAPHSQAARNRMNFVARELNDLINSGVQSPHVISIAAGHARELEALPESTHNLTFTAVDTDADSLEEIRHYSTTGLTIHNIRTSPFRLKPEDAAKADLVYSINLFDHLNDRSAASAIYVMQNFVRPGGKLIIGNLAPKAANLAYCEAIMDWWMVTRTAKELSALSAMLGHEWKIEIQNRQCFNYLVATRVGGNQ